MVLSMKRRGLLGMGFLEVFLAATVLFFLGFILLTVCFIEYNNYSGGLFKKI